MTMQLISTVTVGAGGVGTIDFIDIPQTYDDLYLLFSIRANTAGADTQLVAYMNNFTYPDTLVSFRTLQGNGSVASSNAALSPGFMRVALVPSNADTANTFGSVQISIPNYRGTSAKSISSDSVGENNGTTAYQNLWAGIWNRTNAITRLFFETGTEYSVGSTFSLYGITKGSGGATVS